MWSRCCQRKTACHMFTVLVIRSKESVCVRVCVCVWEKPRLSTFIIREQIRVGIHSSFIILRMLLCSRRWFSSLRCSPLLLLHLSITCSSVSYPKHLSREVLSYFGSESFTNTNRCFKGGGWQERISIQNKKYGSQGSRTPLAGRARQTKGVSPAETLKFWHPAKLRTW